MQVTLRNSRNSKVSSRQYGKPEYNSGPPSASVINICKPKTKRRIKMNTAKRNLALGLLAIMLTVFAAACSQNPVSDQSAASSSLQSSELATYKDKGKKVLNVDVFLNAGEKWKISTSDFDQYGLDAFVAITVDAADPRVPVYQTTGECGQIGIYISGSYAATQSKCSAENFESSEIVLVNHSSTGLAVSAVIIGLNKSEQYTKN